MKNTNKMSEPDKRWKEVFGNAEMTPSDRVWDRIDSTLSKQEAGYFKKRAFIYKLLAAASIIFALGMSLFSINYFIEQDIVPIAMEQANTEIDQIQAEQVPQTSESNSDESPNRENNIEGVNKDKRLQELLTSKDFTDENSQNSVTFFADQGANTETKVTNASFEEKIDRNIYLFGELAAKGIDAESSERDIYEIDHIYLIPIMPRGASRMNKRPESTGFLAGLDFSTGLFDPNFDQGGGTVASTSGLSFADARVESVNDQLTSFNASNKDFLLMRTAGQETKPEISYSYGANFGFRISKRIILQSGIAYRKANTTTVTRGYFEDPVRNTQIPIVASYQYQLDGLSAVKRTAETDLNNEYEFASIPLRAGYMLLDRKINLTLMAGISSELFLNNRIGGNNNEFETLTTNSGDGSPYKRVYFNGSLGTMVGYNFAKNYLITVEPSYRFAVNSFTRNDFYLNSYPSSFMVSFGVAYNFR